MRFWGFINQLTDPIWTTEILFMTHLIVSNLQAKLKIFSTKLCIAITGAIQGTSCECVY